MFVARARHLRRVVAGEFHLNAAAVPVRAELADRAGLADRVGPAARTPADPVDWADRVEAADRAVVQEASPHQTHSRAGRRWAA